MTKEEWEKQQSVVRKVFDPDTGRHRYIHRYNMCEYLLFSMDACVVSRAFSSTQLCVSS